MFYQLPPAGNQILWKQTLSSLVNIRKKVKPFDIFFYNSGAESLAAAIKSIISYKEIDKPEVILSAYACPELVSAILYAGAKPVLIDVEYQRPWISLSELREKISENTIAVVAVNLFGIPERLREISKICKLNNLCLIEDSAQAFPDMSDKRFWQGDFIVLSFGRGKPVSVLGGGAVLCNDADLKNGLPKEGLVFKSRKKVEFIQYRFKVSIYNLLLHPRLYFIPDSLSFLKLGETIFKPLPSIKSIYKENISILDSNIDMYMNECADEKQRQISDIISKTELINLANECNINGGIPKLIRFPVLAGSKMQRDSLYKELNKAGLGVSKMYKVPLNKIDGLKAIFCEQGDFPNATKFSETLLTLPTHKGLALQDIQRLKAIFMDHGQTV